MSKLSDNDINRKLSGLEGWDLDGDSISKQYEFKDFAAAWNFMNQVAVVADKEMNHHPDWSNVYNKVSISLTTHDAGGLTDKDFELAETADKIAANLA